MIFNVLYDFGVLLGKFCPVRTFHISPARFKFATNATLVNVEEEHVAYKCIYPDEPQNLAAGFGKMREEGQGTRRRLATRFRHSVVA